MVDLILSQQLLFFSTRIDEIESQFAENHKKISTLNNDLTFIQRNLNEFYEVVKEM
ncbi:unnamed protein product, partial [Brachionus calyciflorus]